MGYDEALRQLRPHLVLCCWMPLGQDWTADMRNALSVVEYVLIGQPHSSMCGHAWLTWGALFAMTIRAHEMPVC